MADLHAMDFDLHLDFADLTSAAGALSRRLEGYRLAGGELWEHSTAAAFNARWIAQAISYPTPEKAYLAGLLHDVGKLVLDPYVRDEYHNFVESMWKRKWFLWQAEEKLLGINHGRVGGLLGTQWGLPLEILEAVRCHHQPGMATAQPELAAIVNIANAFTPGDTLGLASLNARWIQPAALRILGLDHPALERLRARLRAAREEILQS